MGEAQKLCRFGLDTHSSLTLVQSCRGTSIIRAVLHYTGVNKASAYTRERESSENDPDGRRSQEKRFFFFVRFLLLPVSGQVQVKNSFSHSAGALVFPSSADQEALGSMEIKLRQSFTVQESFALG